VSKSTNGPSAVVTARAGRYYRNARYLLALGVVLYGLWNDADGFYNWPRQNEQDRASGHDKVTYSDMDLLFNRALGLALPPAGLLMLLWALHKSRGEFRLSGQTLHVPGHPPIPMGSIESLDKSQWDRKGIALVAYRLPDGQTGTFKLDDFVYDRDGIDEIYRRIELSFQEPSKEG
jgi:hypothetical protein